MTSATRLAERVRSLSLDGLVVYDVQDEPGHAPMQRPFPFLPTLDPRVYARRLTDLTGMATITYKCIANMTEHSWEPWLTATEQEFGLRYLVLVGLPASRGQSSALPLSRAMQIAAAHGGNFILGGVVIAERHTTARSESQRMLQKARDGCQFFISQAVYHADKTIHLLRDYANDCRQQGVAPQPIILTFVPCGREKTMALIRWLGVAVPDHTAQVILTDLAPLTTSIQVCRDNLRRILDQDYAVPLPLGLNVESVSIYRDEIDASIELVHVLHDTLSRYRRQS